MLKDIRQIFLYMPRRRLLTSRMKKTIDIRPDWTKRDIECALPARFAHARTSDRRRDGEDPLRSIIVDYVEQFEDDERHNQARQRRRASAKLTGI